MIEESLADPGSQAARDAARAETWQFRGEGARRTVDYLMEKLHQQEETAAEAQEIPESQPAPETA